MKRILQEYINQLLLINNNVSYKREIFNTLQEHIVNNNICLVGLRQVGKTTLMLQLAKWYFDNFIKNNNHDKQLSNIINDTDTIFYINLKLINNLNSDEKRNELWINIINKNYKLIVIDEIQELNDWSNFLQTAININTQAKFIVSSSNATSLSKEIMVGRMKTFFIKPLSFNEFKLIWNNDNLEDYLYYGSYPKNKNYYSLQIQYKELINSIIIDKIIMDDYRNKIDHTKFYSFLENINNYIGNEINKSKLESKSITRQTVAEYLLIMKNSQLIHMVSKFEDKNKQRKEKIYFEDKSMIYHFNNEDNLNNNLKGSLIENVVFNRLDFIFQNTLEKERVFYYRNEKENELDFIIPDSKLIIECKYVQNINKEEVINKINSIINQDSKLKDYKLLIITKDFEFKESNYEFISLKNFLERNDF